LELNNKIKTAIISLDIMSKKTYQEFSKMKYLQRVSYEDIWSHYPMVDGVYNPDTMTKNTSIIESYLFLKYLKDKKVNCRFWYANSMFIYNDNLYRIVGKDVIKVDLDGLYYFSFREVYAHPFYKLLEELLENNGGKLAKPNKTTMKNVGCMNKMYAITKLYKKRKEYLQDIIIPYNLKSVDYDVFLSFVMENLGSKVVFKNDCIQEGRGVIIKDLDDGFDKPEIIESLSLHKTRQKELLITPLYEIVAEYRCYFTNYKNAKIFSIKQRVNLTDEQDLFEKENIHINVNMSVKWLEVLNHTDEFKQASDKAYEMIKLMQYDTGCLEFAITKDKKIVFFEVNQMAGPLPFKGDDTKNMNEYYLSIFDDMVLTQIMQ